MCTVTYIPLADDGFIITQSRDEVPSRSALAPQRYLINSNSVIYPKDTASNGTWMASSNQFTLCLLNGGFEKHIPKPPYRQSRGLIIPHFFEYASVSAFLENYSFDNLEPFTLLIFSHPSNEKSMALTFDGVQLHRSSIHHRAPHIWSSATLYPSLAHTAKINLFSNWLTAQKNTIEQAAIIHLHHYKSTQNDSFVFNRNGVKTTSITSVQLKMNQRLICYEDLIAKTEKKCHSFI